MIEHFLLLKPHLKSYIAISIYEMLYHQKQLINNQLLLHGMANLYTPFIFIRKIFLKFFFAKYCPNMEEHSLSGKIFLAHFTNCKELNLEPQLKKDHNFFYFQINELKVQLLIQFYLTPFHLLKFHLFLNHTNYPTILNL